MLTATLPALAALLGCLAYALSSSPKLAELGRIAFACGVLIVLYTLAAHGVHLP